MNENSSPKPVVQADIEHVAALASLALTPEEVARLGKDLDSILAYISELQELDTSGVLPLTHISELFSTTPARATEAVLREDEPHPSLPREVVMQAAPATDGTFFKVPKVIER